MTIHEATSQYEAWLNGIIELDRCELDYKHKQMADDDDPFPFFRGTYYRWAQQWPIVCESFQHGPHVLAIGDLHVENFGTWRDHDARLCWGVNDFDEADELPYTHDLIRLAASVFFAKRSINLDIKFKTACAAIVEGYRSCLEVNGDPFVLEERHSELRTLAMGNEDEPVRFWKKTTKCLSDLPVTLPPPALEAITRDLPIDGMKPEFRRRLKVGMGSLGKPRFVALVEWAGGWIAREVKAVAPPATAWSKQHKTPSRIVQILKHARRSPDPFYRPGPHWIARRLGPHCSRIELKKLDKIEDVDQLLRAMGAETANVHLGTANVSEAILADLASQPDHWLADAAKAMAKVMTDDWEAWHTEQPLVATSH